MNLDEYFDNILKIIFEKQWIGTIRKIPANFVDKAMSLGKSFTEEERIFFITMLRDFDIYSDTSYQFYLEEILKKIVIKEKNIYVAPLLAKKDRNDPYKSSVFVTRFFKSTYVRQLPIFENKNVVIYNDNCILEDYVLLLVDDFIGTGTTAHSCVSYYTSQGIPKQNIMIIVYVVMELGFKKLSKENIKVGYYKKYQKCISGKYTREDAQRFIDLNYDICKKNQIDKPLGFHNSQALVGMQRTPNNTLPIFWDKKIRHPLFPRD